MIPSPISPSNSTPSSHKATNYLPKNFIECPKTDLIVIITRMLTSLILANDKSNINNQNLTRFHSRSPPNISIYSYLTRLAHHSSLENSILIASIYYIDLLSLNYPVFIINSLTVHRYLLTSTTVGSKALCDSFCSNNYYAKVGGVNLMELNLLEIEFLNKVNWKVVPYDISQPQSQYNNLHSSSSSSSFTSTNNQDTSSNHPRRKSMSYLTFTTKIYPASTSTSAPIDEDKSDSKQQDPQQQPSEEQQLPPTSTSAPTPPPTSTAAETTTTMIIPNFVNTISIEEIAIPRKSQIAKAEEILNLYYQKMILLIGDLKDQNQVIGFNDDIVYVLENNNNNNNVNNMNPVSPNPDPVEDSYEQRDQQQNVQQQQVQPQHINTHVTIQDDMFSTSSSNSSSTNVSSSSYIDDDLNYKVQGSEYNPQQLEEELRQKEQEEQEDQSQVNNNDHDNYNTNNNNNNNGKFNGDNFNVINRKRSINNNEINEINKRINK